MNGFLTSNEWQWRLLRTVAQGVLGVVVANVDLLVGVAVLEPAWRALVVALVMAVLSPLMVSPVMVTWRVWLWRVMLWAACSTVTSATEDRGTVPP